MTPTLQSAIAALIVAGSTGYACWALMPAPWRAAIQRKLGRTPAPASGCSGCGGGCAPAPAAGAAPATAVITVHRRPKSG
jgi:hypothetical protein